MSTFDDREHAFEAKFAHDEEMLFKATARRNKLAGLWAAELLGKTGDEAQAYAKTVVIADATNAGWSSSTEEGSLRIRRNQVSRRTTDPKVDRQKSRGGH